MTVTKVLKVLQCMTDELNQFGLTVTVRVELQRKYQKNMDFGNLIII